METISIEMEIVECPDFEVQPGNVSESEEYIILDRILEKFHATSDPIHVMSETLDWPREWTVESLSFHLQQVETEIEEDELAQYLEKNNEPFVWNDLFEEAKLLSADEVDCFSGNNTHSHCNHYAFKYPNGSGFIKFNRPTIINDEIAIVEYTTEICYYHAGYIIILVKENGIWEVKHTVLNFVS